jgi:hypothetical protein
MVLATSMKHMACLAALLLAAGAVHADVITGAGPGAGTGTVESGGKKPQHAGVRPAVGAVTGDGKDVPKKPLTLTTPISKPVTPIARPVTPTKPIPSSGPTTVAAPQAKPQPLLVPAVQKVRESATRAK